MARWSVFPVHASDRDGNEVLLGSKKAVRWVHRWRVDGFEHPRKRTFTFKDSSHPKRDSDTWQTVLQSAELYGWSRDERGWPIDPQQARQDELAANALIRVAPEPTLADPGQTFERYVEDHWWPARRALRLAGNTYEGNVTHMRLATALLRYASDDPLVLANQRRAGASVFLKDIDTQRVQSAVTARATIDLRARRLNEQAIVRAERDGGKLVLRPEDRDVSARSIRAFAIDLGMMLRALPASRLSPDFDWPNVNIAKPGNKVVDARHVPHIDEGFLIADMTESLHGTRRWVAPIKWAAMGGQRPAEHRALWRPNFILHPEEDPVVRARDEAPDDWMAHCWFADSEPPVSLAFSGGDTTHETLPLKHREEGEFRKVPILPEFVPDLEAHFDEFGSRLWTSETGCAMDWGNWAPKFWRPALEAVYSKPAFVVSGRDHLRNAEFKTLRKTAISWWLRSGVSVRAAALYAGNSPEVILRDYASFIDNEDAWTVSRMRANAPTALR